ncbi:MAG: hypothetical protein CW338_05055 [Clostridiales bacterium]|nr:hypothetical protein [Clostridiales bacterium]
MEDPEMIMILPGAEDVISASGCLAFDCLYDTGIPDNHPESGCTVNNGASDGFPEPSCSPNDALPDGPPEPNSCPNECGAQFRCVDCLHFG